MEKERKERQECLKYRKKRRVNNTYEYEEAVRENKRIERIGRKKTRKVGMTTNNSVKKKKETLKD